jgi:hypothetical protein
MWTHKGTYAELLRDPDTLGATPRIMLLVQRLQPLEMLGADNMVLTPYGFVVGYSP